MVFDMGRKSVDLKILMDKFSYKNPEPMKVICSELCNGFELIEDDSIPNNTILIKSNEIMSLYKPNIGVSKYEWT